MPRQLYTPRDIISHNPLTTNDEFSTPELRHRSIKARVAALKKGRTAVEKLLASFDKSIEAQSTRLEEAARELHP